MVGWLKWGLLVPLATLLAQPVAATSLRTFSGEVSQFIEVVPKTAVPDVSFLDDRGARRRLSEFRGKALAVNIWATWCAPCVREMPALERLQEDLGGSTFEVIAISIDEDGATSVRPFLSAMGIDDLAIYLDPALQTVFTKADKPRSDAFPLYGLPMTVFVDRGGNQVGYLIGAADWDAEEARSFIKHLTVWKE